MEQHQKTTRKEQCQGCIFLMIPRAVLCYLFSVVSPMTCYIATYFLEKRQKEPRDPSQGPLRWLQYGRRIGRCCCCCCCSTSTLSCLLFGQLFQGFGQFFRPLFLQIFVLFVGPYGKLLKRFGIGQTLNDDFIGHIIGNSLDKLIHNFAVVM